MGYRAIAKQIDPEMFFYPTFGILAGERSFAANSRGFARIRPDSPRIRANSPTVRQLFFLANTGERLANTRRTPANTGGVRANSRGVRRELADSSPKNFSIGPFTNFRRMIVRREQLFAAND